MPIVSTGQITIVDNNDAKPITAYITANPGTQQVFTKDESAVAYSPDWFTANTNTGIELTAKVFVGAVGSAQDITGQLSNRRWSTDMATAITGTGALISSNTSLAAAFISGAGYTFTASHTTGGSTLRIKSNMLDTVSQLTLYFEGDYTDPSTGIVSRVLAQLTLGLVKTGTNAVYVLTRGQTAIEQATGSTKNVAAVTADLIRAAGVDTTGVTYRFYEANGATQITSSMSTKYGLKSVATGAATVGSVSDIGSNLPASGNWSAQNTLVIHESAVTDMGVYRVEAKDADGTIYQTYFTVYDVSDPYELRITSSAGDKLQNGSGSTNLTPSVYYGATQVSSLSGWTFNWYFWNRDGKRGAFVNPTRTGVAGGRDITAHTTGTSGAFTYSGTAIAFSAGDIIKAVSASGVEAFYEVASATGNTVTIRTPSTNTWLNYTAFPAPTSSQFVGGKLFVCSATLTTTGAAAITLTGDDVDVKGNVTCDANRP